MLTTGSASGEPAYPPGALADVNAATSLASGITTALLGRERHGTGGQVVTTSLVQATAWLQMLGIAVPANTGQRLRPFERGKTANPMMSIYQASDGRWVALGIVSLSRRPWRALLEAIERTEWFESTDWGDSATNRSRSAEEIAVALQERFLERPGREWIARLQEFDIPCSLVNHPAELAGDENMVADNLVATGSDGLRFLSGPFAINGLSGEHTGPAPALGQDTQAVLESMGRSADEIAALFESGAAW
jgi:crotonobetainyl-CoA:carnitine CoA-transferase CaiB-like acyl-CoA transferase